jgi:hypothetical protein
MGAIVRSAALRRVIGRSTAAAAFVVLAATSLHWLGYALLVLGLAAIGIQWVLDERSGRQPELALLAAGVVGNALAEGEVLYAIAGFLLIAATLNEPELGRVAMHDKVTRNLTVASVPPTPNQYALPVNMALTAALAVAVIADLPAWPFLVVNAVACAVYGIAIVRYLGQRAGRLDEGVDQVRVAVEDLAPTFALYHSGPKDSEYQVTMWLPYMERLGRPFIVILRERHALGAVAAATTAPVVVCGSLLALDDMIVPSLKTVFYVNNGMKNSHCVRFRHLTHIQLLHGDSEKPPSYSPVTAMFDKVFVAGQAGIDRYANNGVTIPQEKFAIVGRPQVAAIEASRGHIWDLTDKVVLYAPTWTGHFSDTNYCSLPVAEPLFLELLEHKATIILRPHPYTASNLESVRQLARLEEILAADAAKSGRRHLWGAAATTAMSIVDCFNAADAMVADVSSVISDFLYSGKPFAITNMTDDSEAFAQMFPVARAAYVLRQDMSNVGDAVTQLLETDPEEESRQAMRKYYLGDFPRDRYVDSFLAEARRYI